MTLASRPRRQNLGFLDCATVALSATLVSVFLNIAWHLNAGHGARVRDVAIVRLVRMLMADLGEELSNHVPAVIGRFHELRGWGRVLTFVSDALMVNLSIALIVGAVVWLIRRGASEPRWAGFMLLSALIGLCSAPILALPASEQSFPGIPRLAVSIPIWCAATGAVGTWVALKSRRGIFVALRGLIALSLALCVGGSWLASGIGLGGVSQDTPYPKHDYPNVLLISIDSLRADHLGCYGYERETSPSIDRLAREGVLFEDAAAPTSWTIPSHMSLFTAKDPLIHGVRGYSELPVGVATLAQVFRDAGYHTIGIAGGPTLDARYGFHRGFDVYDDYSVIPNPTRLPWLNSVEKSVELAWEELANWADGDGRRPIFLFVHIWDVHYHYNPPAPYDSLFDPDYTGDFGRDFVVMESGFENISSADVDHAVSLYDGEIRYVDDHLGKLFERMEHAGLFDETIVAVTSDHGEEFLDHGSNNHFATLYQEVVHVPLIVRYPERLSPGVRVPNLARLADVGPTLLDLARVELPAGFASAGQEFSLGAASLMPILRGHDATTSRTAMGDLIGRKGNRLASIRVDSTKLIIDSTNGQPLELFDLSVDPHEQTNLIEIEPELSESLVRKWSEWRSTLHVGPDASQPSDENQLKLLRSLGYIQ